MKKSMLSFLGPDAISVGEANRNKPLRVFDWDKAAARIKSALKSYPDLIAEAGLQGDWAYTGGEIFRNGKPVDEDYTYLASTWATPTLILNYNGDEHEEECWILQEGSRFTHASKWDEQSLQILQAPD